MTFQNDKEEGNPSRPVKRTTPLMIYIVPGKCDFCGCCVGVCPEDAIELLEAEIRIIDERCTNCRKCVWACPWEVIEFHREGIEHLPRVLSLPQDHPPSF